MIAEATVGDGRRVTLRRAEPDDAASMLTVIHAAFGARPVIGAPPDALRETTATIAQALMGGLGYIAHVEGAPAGAILVHSDGGAVRLGRVSVHPDFQRLGVATFMVRALLEVMAARGVAMVTLLARKDYPHLRDFWQSHGFTVTGEEGASWVLGRSLLVVAEVPDADAMRALGCALAALVRPGDLIIASGDLGAGKTTFAQGLGAGMAVEGPIISPTFVLARVHRSTAGSSTPTPTASGASATSRTSTSKSHWPTRSPSSSGARGSPRSCPPTTSRSRSSAASTPTTRRGGCS